MNTATKPLLSASLRDRVGKGSSRSLRREGKVPGIVYSHGKEAMSIALSANEVTIEYRRGRFRSRLMEIKIDGKVIQALPKDVQFHPVSDQIEHVDFIRVEAGQPVRVQVPVKFSGQDKCAGLKRGGVLNIVRHEIEFVCKPESIPASIELNVSTMDIGDSIHINDVKLPDGVTPVIKRNFTIATIAGRSSADEEKPVAAADAAAAAPAAGAAAPAAAAKDAKKDEKKK
ncbi:MAG: 50S ribosomal protein L25/general stress protein Ctc [Alphaproteobacteria bacterium]|nr:50S ribosomal protein L25/general stress protein Ctc [Alphaproteobacteria bacterium]